MITIRIKSSGEVKEVTRNVAFDLIDRGIAVLAKEEPQFVPSGGYIHRQMRPGVSRMRTK